MLKHNKHVKHTVINCNRNITFYVFNRFKLFDIPIGIVHECNFYYL